MGTEAKLINGTVSYAILEHGGNSIQVELSKDCPYGMKVGGIAQTKGGNLKCQKVFHVVLRRWINENDEAEEVRSKY